MPDKVIARITIQSLAMSTRTIWAIGMTKQRIRTDTNRILSHPRLPEDVQITRRSFGRTLFGTILSCFSFAKGTRVMDVHITVDSHVADGMLRVAYSLTNRGAFPLLA